MAPLDAVALAYDPEMGARAHAVALNAQHGTGDSRAVIEAALAEFPGRIAVVSSFGAESAVLLHQVAAVDRSVPVIFVDSGRLFAETLEYRTQLAQFLGLTDVRTVGPEPARVAELDAHRALWMTNPDLCCQIRKTEPLARAISGFDAWFTGRKRFQASTRAAIESFEADGTRVKVNPLATWSAADLAAYQAKHELPAHPLVSKGYPSIGCVPCTTKVLPGEDPRAGRWRGQEKIECGIHLGLEHDGSGI
jgi:phosphoadenosine phosphosulfate reductase